ncbi:MAG: N-acetylneuraminate synthase [Denitrovibrio sp.]|nr:MAG: N-acetylneuraminate synthase [Denitrovibrio sp.]
MSDHVYIIAEAGVNHNGSVSTAKKLIEEAAKAGADAVKFQTFTADAIITKNAAKAEYQKETTGDSETQFEMVKKLELDLDAHKELISHASECGIDFLSSPFDLVSIDVLHNLGLKTFKIPSGEINNLPYLRKLASLKANYIISTCMSNMSEIVECMHIFTSAGCPTSNISLLHVNTQYPTPYEDVNLHAMLTIGNTIGVSYGYSDHTLGIEIATAAVALGASVIEKHFTLDKTMEGPDHSSSLEPAELKAMVSAIRNIEVALGDGIKRPSDSELENIKIVRKSIVAATDIKSGEIFTEQNLTTKRPGNGTSPMRWDKVIGNPAKKDYKKDELI